MPCLTTEVVHTCKIALKMLDVGSRLQGCSDCLRPGTSLQRDHEPELSQRARLGKLSQNHQPLSIDEGEHRMTSASESVSSLCYTMYYSKQVKKSVLVSLLNSGYQISSTVFPCKIFLKGSCCAPSTCLRHALS